MAAPGRDEGAMVGGRAGVALRALAWACACVLAASSSCEHGKERAARALVAAAWATEAPLESQTIARMGASYYAQEVLRAECDSTVDEHNSMLIDTLVGTAGALTSAEIRGWAYISYIRNLASMISDGPSREEVLRGATPASTPGAGTARGIQFPASAGSCRPWAIDSAICVSGCSAAELYGIIDSDHGAMVDAVFDGVVTSVPAVVTHNLELAVPLRSLPENSTVQLSARGCYSSGGVLQVPPFASLTSGCEGRGLASFFYDTINLCSTTLEDDGEVGLLQPALARAHDDMTACDLMDIRRTDVAPADVSAVVSRIVRHKYIHTKAKGATYWFLIAGFAIAVVVACLAALPSRIRS